MNEGEGRIAPMGAAHVIRWDHVLVAKAATGPHHHKDVVALGLARDVEAVQVQVGDQIVVLVVVDTDGAAREGANGHVS